MRVLQTLRLWSFSTEDIGRIAGIRLNSEKFPIVNFPSKSIGEVGLYSAYIITALLMTSYDTLTSI